MSVEKRHISGLDWDHLKVFIVCVDQGSFSKAAAFLSEGSATVSRKIDVLEASFASELFRRSSTGLVLTEEGKNVEKYARSMLGAALGALASTRPSRGSEEGVVTIRTWESMAVDLVSALPRLREKYPRIQVAMIADPRLDEESPGTVDVAISYVPPSRPEYVVKPFGAVSFCWCASRSYIERNGAPTTLQELIAHPLIYNRVFELAPGFWESGMKHLKELANFVVDTDSTWTAQAAILSGNGVGALPARTVFDNPELVSLAVPIAARVPVFLYYPHRSRSIRRCEVVLEWLRNELDATTRPDLNPALNSLDVAQMKAATAAKAG